MNEVKHFTGRCVGGDVEMAGKLSRFPNLVHAPSLKDGKVHTHLCGKTVEEIAESAQACGLVAAIDAECAAHGTDIHELLDAIRFARDCGLV